MEPTNDQIKVIDFGGATFAGEHKTCIINTRQYRAPEVILRKHVSLIRQIECKEWDEKSDVWSAACIFAELYSGEVLFDTHCDFDHLAMIEKVAGTFPHWMISFADHETAKFFAGSGRYSRPRAPSCTRTIDVLQGRNKLGVGSGETGRAREVPGPA